MDKIKEIELKNQRINEQYKKMNLIEIVQDNESANTMSTAIIENSFVVFGDESEFEIPKEYRRLLEQRILKRITDYIYRPADTDSDGLPLCIKQSGDYIFIGLSQGIIRVFEFSTNTELNSLIPKKRKPFTNKVVCMDISLSGNQLVAGYESGKICLYDIFKQKVLIDIDEVFTKKVDAVKFLSSLSANYIVASDKRGYISRISLKRGVIKSTYKAERIMDRPILDICTIAALQPREGMPYEVIEWEALNLTAISNTEQVSIYSLWNPMGPIYGVHRKEFGKEFVRSGSICYLDWGYGVTPNISREKSMWLLAIGWDKVLQICILVDPYKGISGIKHDGYYVCDSPIDSVKFISDSVLMILTNQKEVRILFIPNFSPGYFANEGIAIKETEDSKTTKYEKSSLRKYQSSLGEDLLREFSLKAEVESGNNLLDGNIKSYETANKQNFNCSITACDNNILVLGQYEILLATLYHWEDYLQYIQHKCGWLVCLKTALDIYNGDLKGYYGVPYIADAREQELIHKLKALVNEGIRNMIK